MDMSSLVLLALIILLGAVLSVAISSHFNVPLEVVLLVQSLVLSFVPGLPHLELRPEVIFFLFLPPILFYAAYFTSWRDFKANKRPIGLLAIGLVLFTTVSVAAVLKWLIPEIPWAAGFILGAMISPPDASAATAITRKLGVPRRLVTIIEGESLVNDATALVAYRFAVAAALTGVFSLGGAALRFIWVAVGGLLVGLAIGWIGLTLLRKLQETRAQIVVSFVAAFGSYLAGETLHVSGVISCVTAGLFFGRCLPLYAPAQTRVEGQAAWEFAIFIINAFVFTLIGLQLPSIISHLTGYSWTQLIGYAVAISVAVVIVRFLWIFPATYLPRWVFPPLARKDPAPPWQAIVVLSWTGMRGIVSLAAALALPVDLPHRSLLIFLTYSVILTTLLIPALTLPALLRRLGIHAGTENRQEELRARIAAIESALVGLGNVQDIQRYPVEHVERMKVRYQRRQETLRANMSPEAFSPISLEDQQQRLLLRDLLQWERSALEKLRQGGEIHDEVFHSLARELDLEELRLTTQRL
jgi:monovalent cation/hydrogen antiporter